MRLGVRAAVTAGLLLICSTASGQAASYSKVVDDYFDHLIAAREADLVGGPSTFLLSRVDWKTTEAPLLASTELVKMLAGCAVTSRGYSLGRPGFPKWIQGNYNFECPSHKPDDRAVALRVATSLDGKVVENVVVILGGEVSRMGPPPPNQPRNN